MGSPSTSPVNTMADWSDSLYHYVRGRIKAVNASRSFGGIVQAQDWPMDEATQEAFYMVVGHLAPVRTPTYGGNSWSGPAYTLAIQWSWILIGTDTLQGMQMANRGDRYRLHFQMMQELLQGIYPGWCPLGLASCDTEGAVTVVPYVPPETLRFSKPQFSERIDASTGILFGSALLQVSSFSPAINS